MGKKMHTLGTLEVDFWNILVIHGEKKLSKVKSTFVRMF